MQHRQQSRVAELLFKDTEGDLCVTGIISIKI